MPFYIGDTFGGLQGAAQRGASMEAENYFKLAQMNQQEEARAFAEQQAAAKAQQDAQDSARTWQWTQRQDLLNRAASNRSADLEEAKFNFKKLTENPLLEKRREFDIKQLTDLADTGGINNAEHAAALAPNLQPNEHQQLAARSDAYRKAAEQVIAPIREDANTLNQASLPGADPETLTEAGQIRADKKRLALLRNVRGKWEPAVEQPGWLSKPVAGGNETLTEAEAADIDAKSPWYVASRGDGSQDALNRLLPGPLAPASMNPGAFWANLKRNDASVPGIVTPGHVTPGFNFGGMRTPMASRPVAPALPMGAALSGGPLTPELAKQFILQAGGDKDKARLMARQAGYTF